jgi:FimV-like protein
MGDKDGARELLNEVVQEGDSVQQKQAKELLEAWH